MVSKKSPTMEKEKDKMEQAQQKANSQSLPMVISDDRQMEIGQMAAEIKLMVGGGNKLTDPEALALANFAVVNNLNPTIGEAYYIPKVGPVAGIAGRRRIAAEAYKAEHGENAIYHIVFSNDARDLDGFIDYDHGKDVAYRAELIDAFARETWVSQLREIMAMLDEKTEEKFVSAKEIMGERPSWYGYGVVKKSEYDNPMYNKHDRARKRAESNVLKLRFNLAALHTPMVDPVGTFDNEEFEKLVEPDNDFAVNIIEPSWPEAFKKQIYKLAPAVDETSIISFLENSGMSQDTPLSTVANFARVFQAEIDQNKSFNEAFVEAKKSLII